MTPSSEADIMEHEEKVNNYEAMYAGRLKAKYFSKKTFNGGTKTIFCFI